MAFPEEMIISSFAQPSQPMSMRQLRSRFEDTPHAIAECYNPSMTRCKNGVKGGIRHKKNTKDIYLLTMNILFNIKKSA